MTTNQKETSIEELEDDETKSFTAGLNELKKEIVRLKKICSENWDTMQANITEKEYWRKRIAELEEELEFAGAVVKATKSMAETCKENREAGRDICGACSICFAEMKLRAEEAEAQLEIAIQQRSDAASQRNDLVEELDALEARSDLAEEADALKAERDDLKADLRKTREMMGESSRLWKEVCQIWEDGCKEAQAENKKLLKNEVVIAEELYLALKCTQVEVERAEKLQTENEKLRKAGQLILGLDRGHGLTTLTDEPRNCLEVALRR